MEQGGTVHKVHGLQFFLYLHFRLDCLLHRLFHSLFHTQGGRPVLDALPDHIHMPGIGHLGEGPVDVRHRVRGGQQRPRLIVRQLQRLHLHQDVLPHRVLHGVEQDVCGRLFHQPCPELVLLRRHLLIQLAAQFRISHFISPPVSEFLPTVSSSGGGTARCPSACACPSTPRPRPAPRIQSRRLSGTRRTRCPGYR